MATALTQFETDGQASVLSYNIPEPTIYNGQTVAKLFERGVGTPGNVNNPMAPQAGDVDYAVTSHMLPPAAVVPVGALTLESVTRAMRDGFADPAIFPNVGVPPGRIRYVVFDPVKINQYYQRVYPANPSPGVEYYSGYTGMVSEYDTIGVYYFESGSRQIYGEPGRNFSGYLAPDGNSLWLSNGLRMLSPATVLSQLQTGFQLRIFVDGTNKYSYRFELPKQKVAIAIIEKYRLSTFLGNYGAGRTLQTFSLLPGEKTKLSVKTYKRSTTTAKAASSVLDSYTQESAHEFERSVADERANKAEQKDSQEWHVEAEVEQNWGVVAVKAKAGYSGGTASARESTARSMNNATQKHAAKASSKRDINITQTSETKEEEGTENSNIRDLQNINVGSTLNFVFRQMNQQYYTVFHLVDAQLAYFDTTVGIRRFSFGEIESLLDLAVGASPSQGVSGASTNVNSWAAARILLRNRILSEMLNIIDHTGTMVPFVEEKVYTGPVFGTVTNETFTTRYWRTRSDMLSTFTDPETTFSIQVPGVILGVTTNVMRTDAVIADSVLGLGQGLDMYSQTLQTETVRLQRAQNDLQAAQSKRVQLAAAVLGGKDATQAAIFGQVFPPPPLVTTTTTTTPVPAPAPVPAPGG